MKRILFVQVQIDREPELQLLRSFREKTRGDDIFEDIARKSHGRLGDRRKIQAAHPAESIAAGKKADIMGRKADRVLVTVGRLITQP